MTDRKRHLLRLAVSLLAIPVFGTMLFAFPDEDDQQVSLSDLPAVIQKALSNINAEDIEIEIEIEMQDGKRVYEVEIEADDAEVELTLSEDGRLLDLEIEVEDDGDQDDD